MPWRRRIEATESLALAPWLSQYSTRSLLTCTCVGPSLRSGSYRPRVSRLRPSRGKRESVAVMRKQGRFVRPVRRRRMTTAMSVGSGWGLAMRPGALRAECGANRTHFPAPDGKGRAGNPLAAALLVLLLLARLARVRGAHR